MFGVNDAMDQPTFADLEYDGKKRKTRREIFLERMDSLIPWDQLEERMSIARVYRPVVARVIEPPCGPVDGLLSPLGLRVNHLLSVEQGPVG